MLSADMLLLCEEAFAGERVGPLDLYGTLAKFPKLEDSVARALDATSSLY